MKVRTDFVTNSSSSSYVIARKADCRVADIFKLIDNPENIDAIKNTWGFDEQNRSAEEILWEIADELFYKYGLHLEDWIVNSQEFGNEMDFIGAVIYEQGLHIADNDMFKMR